MSATKSLKILLISGKEQVLNNIDEFTSGYCYLYIRHLDGKTISIDRSSIQEVTRVLLSGRETSVFLKKPKH